MSLDIAGVESFGSCHPTVTSSQEQMLDSRQQLQKQMASLEDAKDPNDSNDPNITGKKKTRGLTCLNQIFWEGYCVQYHILYIVPKMRQWEIKYQKHVKTHGRRPYSSNMPGKPWNCAGGFWMFFSQGSICPLFSTSEMCCCFMFWYVLGRIMKKQHQSISNAETNT